MNIRYIYFSVSRLSVLSFLLMALTITLMQVQPAMAQNLASMGIQRTTENIMKNEQRMVAQLTIRPVRIKVESESEVLDDLPQNPLSPAVSKTGIDNLNTELAKLKGSTLPLASTAQTTSVEFTGATIAETRTYPPDTMGAVGPTQFIVAVNGLIRTFNKSSGIADGVLNTHMEVFFSAVMNPAYGTYPADPRIRYDRFRGRWIVTSIDIPSTRVNNRILLAVSNNSTITASTVWTFFYFQHNLVSSVGDTGCLADYPTIGIDVNALYIGTNQYCPTFTSSTGFVIQKNSILGTGPIIVHAFRNLGAVGIAGLYTPQGVDNFDSSAPYGYFIGIDSQFYGKLTLRRVSNAGSTSPTISGNISLTVPTTYNPLTVPHLGNTNGTYGYLDATDTRLFAAVIRNGRMWTAHNIRVDSNGVGISSGDRNAVRWYELQNLSSTPSLIQAGTIFDNAVSNPIYYWMGTVMVSGQGHAAFGMSASNNMMYASAATIGRLSGDLLGTTQGAPVVYESGVGAYNPPIDTGFSRGVRRWGDYSYTSLDPCDDMTMWTIQEFTNANNSYGVRAVKLMAPPPAVLPGGTIATLLTGTPSTLITLTGTSPAGQGFYEPGAGFNCHLTASVSNGVRVTQVTYTSPTSVTLDLSTLAASAGFATVTVTNPDGQRVSTTIDVQLLGPPPLGYFTTATPILTWNRVSWATQYRIQVSTSRTFTSLSYENFVPASQLEVTVDMLVNGVYYWRVSANNGVTWSAVDSFTIAQ